MKLLFEKEHIKNACSCFLPENTISSYISSTPEILSSSIPFVVFNDKSMIKRGVEEDKFVELEEEHILHSCIASKAYKSSQHHTFAVDTSNFVLLIEDTQNMKHEYFIQLLFERECNFLLLIDGVSKNNIHIQCDFKYDSTMSLRVQNSLSKISIFSILSSHTNLYKEVFVQNAHFLEESVLQKDHSKCQTYYLIPFIEKQSFVFNENILGNHCESHLYLKAFLLKSYLSFKSKFTNTKDISKSVQSLLVMRMDEKSKCDLYPILSLSGKDNICSHEAFLGEIAEDVLSFFALFGIKKHSAQRLFLSGFMSTQKNTFKNEIQDIIATYRK